jgi:hypothetical protein
MLTPRFAIFEMLVRDPENDLQRVVESKRE